MKKRSPGRLHGTSELSAREVLIPLLSPAETLRIALRGATGWFEGLSLVDLVLGLLDGLGGVPSSRLNRTTYIGTTDRHLVYAISKDPEKPSSLQRVPLGSVSIARFNESRTPFLIDVLVIDTGTKRLTLSTGYGLRPVIRQLAATLPTRRQEADTTDSAGLLQGALAEQAPPLPLRARLSRPFASALQEVAVTLRVDGPARASIRASRYSFILFAASIPADLAFVFGAVALGSIFPTASLERLRDILLFILLLPLLLVALLGVITALVAAGLAIYSIFKKGERPLLVIAALLRIAALAVCYGVAAFGAVLLGG